MARVVKSPPANAGDVRDVVRSLDWRDPLEEGMATCSSILAWRIPGTEEPGALQSVGSQRVEHDWRDLAHTHACACYHGTTAAHFLNRFLVPRASSTPSSWFTGEIRSSFPLTPKPCPCSVFRGSRDIPTSNTTSTTIINCLATCQPLPPDWEVLRVWILVLLISVLTGAGPD